MRRLGLFSVDIKALRGVVSAIKPAEARWLGFMFVAMQGGLRARSIRSMRGGRAGAGRGGARRGGRGGAGRGGAGRGGAGRGGAGRAVRADCGRSY